MSGINELIEFIRKEGGRNYTPPLFYATITKPYPNTELTFNDITLVKQQIRYTSWIKFLCEGYVTDGANAHSHKIRDSRLKKGDTVLIKFDGDSVLILDRVVV